MKDSSKSTLLERSGDWWVLRTPLCDRGPTPGCMIPGSRGILLGWVQSFVHFHNGISQRRSDELQRQIMECMPEVKLEGDAEHGFTIVGIAPEYRRASMSMKEVPGMIQQLYRDNVIDGEEESQLKRRVENFFGSEVLMMIERWPAWLLPWSENEQAPPPESATIHYISRRGMHFSL